MVRRYEDGPVPRVVPKFGLALLPRAEANPDLGMM
jgi:hypothetical protein